MTGPRRRTHPGRASFRIALVVLAAAGLANCSTSSGTAPQEGPIESALAESIEELQCFVRDSALEDCDGDGVSNLADVVPFRDDEGDDDADLVINRLDRWPGEDDLRKDTDADGVVDYLDAFFGDNAGDADADGWPNGIDVQPYSAPPQQAPVTLPPASMTQADLARELVLDQNRRAFIAEAYGPSNDRDGDGSPDDIDVTPTAFTNDRDGDGDADFYDPEPGDGTLDSWNDPYDPRNDAYWED